MNLYIYEYQGQQIGIIEETEEQALLRYRQWAENYNQDLSQEPMTYLKSINTIGPGMVLQSWVNSQGKIGLDAYWGAFKESR